MIKTNFLRKWYIQVPALILLGILLLATSSCGISEEISFEKGILFPGTKIEQGSMSVYVEDGESVDIYGILLSLENIESPIVIFFDENQLYQDHFTIEDDVSLHILSSQYKDDWKKLSEEYFSDNPNYFPGDSLALN